MQLRRSQTLQFGFGYATSAGCRLLRDLVIARTVGPALFGLWAGLSVARQYLAYSDLGFTNGLGRLLPRTLRERGEADARMAMGNAWVVAMGATALFVVGAAALSWSRLTSGQSPIVWGIVTIIVLTFLEKHQMYSSAVFASVQRVGESGLYMGLLGASELLLCSALTRPFGLYGLYVGLVAALMLTLGVMASRQPLRASLQLDHRVQRDLAFTSLTIMGYGLANVALHNVDRVAIVLRRGAGEELAQYHIATILSLVVNALPYVVLSVLIPQVYRFGGDRPLELRRYLLLPTAMMAVLGVVVGSLVYVIVPPVLALYLPSFRSDPALLAALVLAELGFSIAMVPATMMIALDRNIRGLVVRLVAVAAAFAGSLVVLSPGGSVVSVGWVMVAAQWLGMLALGGMASRGAAVAFSRFLLVALLPVAYGVAVQGAIHATLGNVAGSAGEVAARAGLCLALMVPLVSVPMAYLGRGPLAGERARAFLHWPRGA